MAVDVDSLPLQSGTSGAPGAWTLYGNAQRVGFLVILFLVTTSHYFAENILSVLLEPIKHEFKLSDTQLGLLSGPCFALVYAIGGFPLALWADRADRRVVIAFAVAGWNLMTAVCGFAQSFWQLSLARFGVGALEPGGIPLTQSLVADYFPPERRAIATTMLFYGAAGVAWLCALGPGGAVAEMYGWRAVLVLAAIPGVLLAVMTRLILPEPRYVLGFPRAQGRSESVRQTFLSLWRKRSILFAVAGVVFCAIFGYGVTLFVPSFLIRSFHATLQQRSEVLGTAIAISYIAGALLGGWIADRLGRDIRWYARVPAITCIVVLPLYALAYRASSFWLFIGFQFVADLIQSAGIAVVFVAISVVCGKGRRAIAAALTLSIMMFLGASMGPLLVGALSDALGASNGVESLRHAMTVMCCFWIPAAALFYGASRTMLRDRED